MFAKCSIFQRMTQIHELMFRGHSSVTLCCGVGGVRFGLFQYYEGRGGAGWQLSMGTGLKFCGMLVANATRFSHFLPGFSCGSKHLLLP